LSARVSLSGERYRQDATAAEFTRRLVERTAALPGAESAATIALRAKRPREIVFELLRVERDRSGDLDFRSAAGMGCVGQA